MKVLVVAEKENGIAEVWVTIGRKWWCFRAPLRDILLALGVAKVPCYRWMWKGVRIAIGGFEITPVGVPLTEEAPFFMLRTTYKKKYGIGDKLLKNTFVRGIPLLYIRGEREAIMVLDEPPPLTETSLARKIPDKRKAALDAALWLVSPFVKGHTVRFVRIRPKWQVKVSHLYILAELGLLYRLGKFYYFLYNPLNKSLEEIRQTYPDLREIIYPRRPYAKKCNWDALRRLTREDIAAVYAFKKWLIKKTKGRE